VLAAYQGQFADEPLKNGANAQIQLRSTAASSPEAKNAFIKSFQPRDFDSLLPYWDFLGADKMRSLALLFDGDARLVPGGTNIEEGIAADDQNGCAFGRWMELLAENDPKSAAQTGPALLAKYDPAGKLYAARAAVAGACAKYGGPAGVAWADAWVDSFKNLPPFPDPGIYIDGDTDSVNPLFRVAGVANALGRADAGKLTQAALAAATLTGPSSELEFAKYWGKSLAAGGVPAMHLLDGQLPAPARLKAWSGAMELLAQQDSTASEAVWTELNTLQSDPDVQAWDKRPELDRNWDNLGIVMRDARMALQTAEAQTGSTDQLTAFSAGKNRRGARLLALLATVALRNHDQATARTATSDAMDDSDWQGWRSYAAALAASFDPTLGEQLFNRIRTDLTNNPTAQDLQDGDLVNYAYYHGFQDQAESHLLLEFAWRYLDTSSKDSGDWERGQYDNSRFQTAASLFPLDENVALLELGEPQETIDAKKAARARVLTMMFSDRATWSLIPPG